MPHNLFKGRIAFIDKITTRELGTRVGPSVTAEERPPMVPDSCVEGSYSAT
jgi:hypothetical protein